MWSVNFGGIVGTLSEELRKSVCCGKCGVICERFGSREKRSWYKLSNWMARMGKGVEGYLFVSVEYQEKTDLRGSVSGLEMHMSGCRGTERFAY